MYSGLGIAAMEIAGDRPWVAAIPRGCADPQGLPHRSCFQQHFQGRLHALKQLTCTVLVRMSEPWMRDAIVSIGRWRMHRPRR
jgi:hypothetical protein